MELMSHLVRRARVALLVLAGAAGGAQSLAKGNTVDPGAAPGVASIRAQKMPVANCWVDVAAKYRIPSSLLFAIAMVESGLNPAAVNQNANGTGDVGYMQVNSWWFPKLAQHGIRPGDLAEPCVSIHVGAWILAYSFHQLGYTWQGIGAYNATDPYKRWRYAQHVYAMHDMVVEWQKQYRDGYAKAHLGQQPLYMPKPPDAWVAYAQRNALTRIAKAEAAGLAPPKSEVLDSTK